MARAAVLVAVEVADVGGSLPLGLLLGRWQDRYPRHAEPTARRSLRTRALRSLRALALIGVVALADGDDRVTVVDIDRLHLIARNLEVFEDHNGIALRPSYWPSRPDVPLHLGDLQSSVIAAGMVRLATGRERDRREDPGA